jgi:hypothetical protein
MLHRAQGPQALACDPQNVHVLLVDDELLSRLVVGECGVSPRALAPCHPGAMAHAAAPFAGNLLRKCNYRGESMH